MKADSKSADVDQAHATKTYCAWRFFLGSTVLICASWGHISLMPFLSLTLMGCNSAFAIMTSMVLSVWWLGERFVPKNDIPALLLISAGCATIVCTANTDAVEYTAEEAVEYLLSWRAISYYVFTVSFVLLTIWVTACFLRALRQFELDVETQDQELIGSDNTS